MAALIALTSSWARRGEELWVALRHDRDVAVMCDSARDECRRDVAASGLTPVAVTHLTARRTRSVPYEKPLARTKEVIDVCRRVWRREVIEHHGATIDIPLREGQGTGLAKPLKLGSMAGSPPPVTTPPWNPSTGSCRTTSSTDVAGGPAPNSASNRHLDRTDLQPATTTRAWRSGTLPSAWPSEEPCLSWVTTSRTAALVGAGPSDSAVLYGPEDVVADRDGLETVKTERVRRPVHTDDGEKIAIDVLVRARRPPQDRP